MENKKPNLLKIISIVQRKTQMYLSARAKAVGLSHGLVPFLLITCQNGQMPQNHFCELLDMSKGTVAKMLAKLEEQEYIVRKENEQDGRSVVVYPTQKALDIYPYFTQVGDDWTQVLTQGLTDIERTILFEMLDTMSHNASKFFDSHQS